MKLKEKASVLFNQFRSGTRPSDVARDSQVLHQHGVTDELAILGGQTRILFNKTVLPEAPNWDATPTIMRVNATTPQSIPPLNSETLPDPSPSTAFHPPIEREDTAMQDVHPSLVAYMTMLSSTTTSKNDFAGYPDEASSLSLDQPIPSGSEEFSPFTVPTPDFFTQQATDYLMQQDQTQTRMASPFYDPDLFGPFEQFYQEAATYTNADSAAMWPTADFGLSQSANDSSDERWMAFITESAAPTTSLDAFNVM